LMREEYWETLTESSKQKDKDSMWVDWNGVRTNNQFAQHWLTNQDFSFGILSPLSLPCAQLEVQNSPCDSEKGIAMSQTWAWANKRFLFWWQHFNASGSSLKASYPLFQPCLIPLLLLQPRGAVSDLILNIVKVGRAKELLGKSGITDVIE
jgi:hypothetical protein